MRARGMRGAGAEALRQMQGLPESGRGIHPDIIDVRRMTDDKWSPKREIMVDQVRTMAADASILPNEAERSADTRRS